MKITVIGTGYVGLVSGVCYSEMGHQVICVDKNESKIKLLNTGQIPIYEPGLKEFVVRNMKQGRLEFTNDLSIGLKNTDVVFIAVGTPPLSNGEADLQYVVQAAREVALLMEGSIIIAIKSTVPVGTNHNIRDLISRLTNTEFEMVSVPEFLREGTALRDTLNPDRIVIGAESQQAIDKMLELHSSIEAPIVVTDLKSAEMIKYASNAFLATKISFINEIANICEKVGANVNEVAHGMGLDRRIGSDFLKAGIGYGGSCFPKDTKALIQIAGNADYDFKLLKSVVEVNQLQRGSIISKLRKALGELEGKTVTLWGLSFKPGTDDVRESPAIDIAKELLRYGINLRVYDPVSMNNFRQLVNDTRIYWAADEWDAANGSDALCLLTEWDVFKHVDLKQLKTVLRSPNIIDGRNIYHIKQMVDAEIFYYPVGKKEYNPSLEHI